MDNELSSLHYTYTHTHTQLVTRFMASIASELGGQSAQQQKITHHRSSNNIKPASNPSGNVKNTFVLQCLTYIATKPKHVSLREKDG